VYHQTGVPLSRYHEHHGFSTPAYDYFKIGIALDRDELYRRIDERVERMFAGGLVAEVERLQAQGYGPELKSMGSIGYREVCALLAGTVDLTETKRLVARNTRWYAKRQLTWFRREEEINWVEYPESFASILETVIAFLEKGADPCQKPHSISRIST
jgi:tRNA dimethylallyltransferase